MTIDVQLGDIGHSLLGSGQLSTINQTELALGLGGDNIRHHSETHEQPLSATPSPAGSLQDEDMDDFKVSSSTCRATDSIDVCLCVRVFCCCNALLTFSLFCVFLPTQRSVLVDPPMSFSSSSVLSHMSSHLALQSSLSPATARRDGGKPSSPASVGATMGAKKGKKKKDPNEPQKPVSAYALFFRDTQAAIKGQNPNASFGEVSKIVASMWDSLAEEQKQVFANLYILMSKVSKHRKF